MEFSRRIPRIPIHSSSATQALVLSPAQSTTPLQSPVFLRGDGNRNGSVDLSDRLFERGALFQGTAEILCDKAADTNDDEVVDLTDPILLMRFLFLGGVEIPAPGPVNCGEDPTTGVLGCEDYTVCP